MSDVQELKGRIESEIDLADYSKVIEDELLEASLNDYQLYLDQLDASTSHLDTLLADTTATLDLLSELSSSFKTVETQTSAFQAQSETLLSSQSKSEKLATDIKDHLRYYEYLEPITRRLNAPGAGNLVRGRGFSEMLVQLDEAIDYMQAHPTERESETYRSRYKLLLTRALTLVRGHFVNVLKDTAADVTKRIADRQLNDTTMSALLYAKFRVGAEEMKTLGLEIHKRASPPADADPDTEGEYQSLMNELHTNFAATREKLILPLVRKKLADIAQAPSTSTDLIKFARASISYIRGICLDEFELWAEWFHGQRGLYDFLESICEPLYDHLRPRIIYESKLTKLCQLCILLQTRYMLQDPEDEVEQITMPDPNQLDFAALIRPALEDTQTRIVFRTQAIVRNEIELYKPKAEDLDYPRRLHRRQSTQQHRAKSQGPVLSGRKESLQPTTPITPILKDPLVVDADLSDEEDDHTTTALPVASTSAAPQTTYPTLSLCLTLLTRLHRLINTSIFDDLAHQIVHQTLLSLSTASSQLPKPPKDTSATALPPSTSANLFLLTHYLHLKTHLLAFDISSQNLEPDITFDFSGPLSTFTELRERGINLFNPVNLMRLISNGTLLPRVVENMLDAKLELDGRLRSVINDFVGEWSNLMTQTLQSLPSKLPAKSKQTKASPFKQASSMLRSTLASIETTLLPTLRKILEEWIVEPPSQPQRIKDTLIAAILENVVRSYEVWYEALPPDVRRGGAGKGKGKEKAEDGEEDEMELWDIDRFEMWVGDVFGIRHSTFLGDGGDGDNVGLGIQEIEEPEMMGSDYDADTRSV